MYYTAKGQVHVTNILRIRYSVNDRNRPYKNVSHESFNGTIWRESLAKVSCCG